MHTDDIFTRENNILFSHLKRSPLLWLHNPLKITWMCCCMIETSSVPPRKSSVIFGNRQLFSNIFDARKRLSGLRTTFEESSPLVCLYNNKQNNTWLLRDMKFLFECSTGHRVSAAILRLFVPKYYPLYTRPFQSQNNHFAN